MTNLHHFVITVVTKPKEPVAVMSVLHAAQLQDAHKAYKTKSMRLLIIYRPNSEHSRAVEEFVHDFKKQKPDKAIELLTTDTIDGTKTAELYDIVSYPSVLALANDGQILKIWQNQLPLINDLLAYAVGV